MPPARIGVVGTGFAAHGFIRALARERDLALARVLTRRPRASWPALPFADALTDDPAALIASSDLVVECSGDVIHATAVLEAVQSAGLPIVTMDAELQVTTGSWFAARGVCTEAHGDQPGCLAALREEAVAMGFRPLVYGNIKSFLDPDPARAEMERWAARQGLSLAQTVSFTDGTKLQFEMALVANGLGARLAKPGMIGARDPDLAAGARLLAAAAGRAGGPIADYALYAGSPPGVFVVATRDDDGDRQALRNMRLGDGPHYLLVRPYHLCHLEIPRTVRRVLGGGGPLLDNGARPRFGVVAIAKVPLEPGRAIERGIGSFDVRGEARALDGARGLVPLGLLAGARLRRAVAPGQPLAFDDVELPPSRALELWRSLIP